MLLEPVVEIGFRRIFLRVVTLCNKPLRRAVGQQTFDFGLVESIQLYFFFEAQSLFDPLRYQMEFDLCRHQKRQGNDLVLDGVI